MPQSLGGERVDTYRSETVRFGTSGLRGPAAALIEGAAYRYASAFAAFALERGDLRGGGAVLIGRDMRETSPAIADICAAAIRDAGFRAVDCGAVPTPALALKSAHCGAPAIMVSGSHIAEDRNGLKFYLGGREITKADEVEIAALERLLVSSVSATGCAAFAETGEALEDYVARATKFFGSDALLGLTIGVWQHSSVSCDLLVEIVEQLGGRAVPFGLDDDFVAIDTEALAETHRLMIADWASANFVDAIISTDADGDRPLVFDAQGTLIDGDVVGALTARWLGIEAVVTPVTSNAAIERCFADVRRCRVGSPFVIEALQHSPLKRRIGFEANGGVILDRGIMSNRRKLPALPTRDAVLPILCCLAAMREAARPLAGIVCDLGFGAKATARITDIDNDQVQALMAQIVCRDWHFLGREILEVDRTDGLRLFLEDGTIVHFRQSGNAPEFRVYIEASTSGDAENLLGRALAFASDRMHLRQAAA